MFIEPDRVVHVTDEYRSGTGKVLTAGDEVRVKHRKGKWRFREALHRESGKVDLMLIGAAEPYRGKHGYARPGDVSRTAKAPLPKGATTARQRWGSHLVDVVADSEGEAQSPLDEVTVAEAHEAPEDHEGLICEACGQDWTRKRVRGRKPKRCPDCR